ncbi:MAG: hypothetical protein WBP33_09315 [Saprospiraceae bacterium]|nr:hypothetical protein [Candidatus Vicinibacter proximus]
MKKFLLMFGACLAFNAMVNAQTPRPDRSGGPAAAPTATEAKPTDASGKSTSTKPAATTTSTKPGATSSATKPAAGGDGTAATDGNIRDHKCTAACKGGNHVLAHGEKGHVCTAACKRKPTTQRGAPVKGPNPTK